MEFLDEELDRYVCAHTENEPVVLQELNRDTHVNVLKPRMLSGHFQGRVLSMFVAHDPSDRYFGDRNLHWLFGDLFSRGDEGRRTSCYN